MDNVLVISEKDNVGIITKDTANIPVGHKIALRDIAEGAVVFKYGYPIGRALMDISKGSHVHTHNLKTLLDEPGKFEYKGPAQGTASIKTRMFKGYVREDGQAGVRNEIWIIPTVGCVNGTVQKMEARARDIYTETFAFTHPYGCSQLGSDHRKTQNILAGLVKHPNAASVLVVGLGCENNNIGEFKKVIGDVNPDRLAFLNCQDEGDEIEKGLETIKKLACYAETFKREDVPISRLVVGLKCGGSDAFSGITANPLAGYLSDQIVSMGGTALLTEIPEMFGAEQVLADRSADEEVFYEFENLINSFKRYYTDHGQKIYENPSPGNKDGGISTLEEKSLGCVQKGGSGLVTGVLRYGGRVRGKKGLLVLEGPGNDIVAQTALTAAGAQIIVFTTGRGTPLGAPVPTVKVSSNTELYNKKRNWMDFNAGRMLENSDLEEIGEEFLDHVINTASGQKTANEKNGYREIAIFKDGVTL